MHKDFYVQHTIADLQGVRLAVAHLVMQGHSVPDIAQRLCLSSSSIKKYIVEIKELMDCETLHGLSAKLTRMSLEDQNTASFQKKEEKIVLKVNAFFREKENTKLLGGEP